MPSPIAHITAGYTIFKLSKNKLPGAKLSFWMFPCQLVLLASLSLLPDLDFLIGLILGDIERYHNNFSHSLLCGFLIAIILSIMVKWLDKSNFMNVFIISVITYDLHAIMDMFTGDRGVMLFWPLVQTRFSSPVKLFFGVQWGKGLFSILHVWTILSEIGFFLLIYIIVRITFRMKKVKRKIFSEEENLNKLIG